MGLALPFHGVRENTVSYCLVIVNGDGRAEVLSVPHGDDPHFIAGHYNVLDI